MLDFLRRRTLEMDADSYRSVPDVNEEEPLLQALALDFEDSVRATTREVEDVLDRVHYRGFTFWSRVVPILFGICAVYAIIALLVAYFDDDLDPYAVYLFMSVLLMTIIASVFGQYGVYKWGTPREHLRRMRTQSDHWIAQNEKLQRLRDKMKEKLQAVNHKVEALEYNAKELEETDASFDKLRKELEKVCGDNDSLNDLLGSLNSLFDDNRRITYENERAWLLSTFYEVSLRDGVHGIHRKEFDHFLARLPKSHRAKFETAFENTKGMNRMDLDSFERIIKEFLASEH